MAHQLHIRVQDSLLDSRYIYVTDFSDYDPLIPILNHTLMVQPPGYETPVGLLFTLKGQNAYSQKSMEIVKFRSQNSALSDGLYAFTYSVSPNQNVYTLVYHFRTTVLEGRIYNGFLQSRLLLAKDEFNEKVFNDNIHKLIMAEKMLAGLKRNLSSAADLTAVNNEYNEVVKLVESLNLQINC